MTKYNELKRLAEGCRDEVIRSHGWVGMIEDADLLRRDEQFLKECSPEAILALLADNEALRQDAERLRWLRQYEFDIGSYHGVHEHNAAAWFEDISDEDIDSMMAAEAQFAKDAGHE